MAAADSKTFTLNPDDIPFATNGVSQPTFYADNIRGSIVTPDVVKLNMVEIMVEAHGGGVVAKHSCTVIVPRSQIRAWAKFLSDLADDNGFPPLVVPEAPKKHG
jgi:hypothetical protein